VIQLSGSVYPTQMKRGRYSVAGKRMTPWKLGPGRGGWVVKAAQMSLWNFQSVFWQVGEQ
jgi:hypothetical protein